MTAEPLTNCSHALAMFYLRPALKSANLCLSFPKELSSSKKRHTPLPAKIYIFLTTAEFRVNESGTVFLV